MTDPTDRVNVVTENPLATLSAAGVAVWLDDLSRARIDSDNLAALIANDHVVGVTTNPSIFAAALSKGEAYDPILKRLALRGVTVEEAARTITAADVRDACDLLRRVFDATDGVDGRVSLEVDPRLARNTDATLAEARHLWWLVDRPNLLIKIPATLEGLPAITACIGAGISVNVTLIFSLERYGAVMDAWLSGLEQAHSAGLDLTRLTSVASFFVSRVDSEVDKRLEKIGTDEAMALRGRAAIANARLAWSAFLKVTASERWQVLERAGAKVQRPLWASTGVKDPAYDDTRYVVDLVAEGTVNTMPEGTLRAVADHGVVRADAIATGPGGEDMLAGAVADMTALAAHGIQVTDVTQVLEVEGVDKFMQAWDQLLAKISEGLSGAAKA